VKKNCVKKSKPLQDKSEKNSLVKEIDELIEREKTKSRIVSKLLKRTTQTNIKSDS
jgi:hypothetical protein